MVRLVRPEHVIDEVAGDGDLPAGLFLARMPPLDQPGNDGGVAECALQQVGIGQPRLQIVAQHVLIEQGFQRWLAGLKQRAHIAQPPHGERIIGSDEAERPRPRPFQTPGQEHAECLVCQPAFKRKGDEIEAVIARKGFNEQLVLARQPRFDLLNGQPVAHLGRQFRPALRIGEHCPHHFGEIGGQRKLAAGIGRHAGILAVGAGDIGFVFADALEGEHGAGELKRVALYQLLQKVFLHLAKHPAAAATPGHCATPLDQPHIEHRRFDDGADIQPVLLGNSWMGNRPQPVLALPDAGVALIGF